MSSLTENSSRQNSGYEDVSTRPMTVDDVVTKTGITLGVIIVAAAINFALGMLVSPGIAMALTLVGGIGAARQLGDQPGPLENLQGQEDCREPGRDDHVPQRRIIGAGARRLDAARHRPRTEQQDQGVGHADTEVQVRLGVHELRAHDHNSSSPSESVPSHSDQRQYPSKVHPAV